MPEYRIKQKGMSTYLIKPFIMSAPNKLELIKTLKCINPGILIRGYNFKPITYAEHFLAAGHGGYEELMELPEEIRKSPAHFNQMYFEIEEIT